jgi:thiol-disulfide isomerase/thioredoxin
MRKEPMAIANQHFPATRGRLVAVVASTCLLILIAACGKTAGNAQDGGPAQGADGITRLVPAERGKPVEVVGVDLDGKPLSSKQWLGKVVVVNIWGSWCPPCRVEQPVLSQLATELKPSGVEFLGIAVRESPETSKAFTTAKKVPYPSIGNGESAILAFADSLPAVAVPTTYIIDRDGRVATRLLDRATYTTLKDLIDEVASEVDGG